MIELPIDVGDCRPVVTVYVKDLTVFFTFVSWFETLLPLVTVARIS